MSKIKVNEIEKASGSGITVPTGTSFTVTDGIAQASIADQAINEAKLQVSNAPTNGHFLSAQSGNTGGLTWAEAGGSITEADMYRLHTTQTSSSETILVNWERVDDASFGKIGTGLSVSSGIFTFGATGLYHLIFNAETAHEGGAGYVHLYLRGSTDNFSSNDDLARSNNYHDAGHVGYSSIGAFFNCTNTSTHKVACYFNTSFSNAGVNGVTDNTRTSLSAVRLGDSV